MSWSFSVGPVTRSEAAEALKAASGPVYVTDVTGAEIAEQKSAAIDSALALLAKGVVGNPDTHSFYISLSGHANLEHKPAPGWANDCITVYVSQDAPLP